MTSNGYITVLTRSPRTPFDANQVNTIVPIVAFAGVSLLSILVLAARVLFVYFKHRVSRYSPTPPKELVFFRSQLGVYTICLIIGNTMNAITGLLEITWVLKSAVEEGHLCTLQAALGVMSDFAIAFFTVITAIHTFGSLVLRFRTPVWVTSLTIVAGWVFTGLISIVPIFVSPDPVKGPLYGNNTVMCSIVPLYPVHQFLMNLFPIFFTAVVTATLYAIIFLVLRGTLVMKGGLHLDFNPDNRWSQRVRSGFEEYHAFLVCIAKTMMWYPVAYLVLVVPSTVTLLMILSGFRVLWTTQVFATSSSLLLGVANSLLIFNTIRVLSGVIALSPPASKNSSNGKDLESFGSPDEKFAIKAGLKRVRESLMPKRSEHTQFAPAPPLPVLVHARTNTVGSIRSIGSTDALLPPSIAWEPVPSIRGLPSSPRRNPRNSSGGSSNFSARSNPYRTDMPIKTSAELNRQMAAGHARSASSLGLPPPPRSIRSTLSSVRSAAAPPELLEALMDEQVDNAAFRRQHLSANADSVYSLYLQHTPGPEDANQAFHPVPVHPTRQPSVARTAVGAQELRPPSLTAFGVQPPPMARVTAGPTARRTNGPYVPAPPPTRNGYSYL